MKNIGIQFFNKKLVMGRQFFLLNMFIPQTGNKTYPISSDDAKTVIRINQKIHQN